MREVRASSQYNEKIKMGGGAIAKADKGKLMNNDVRNRRALGDIGNQIPSKLRANDAKQPTRPVNNEVRNWRALGDIGNQIPSKLKQPTHPVTRTRSFYPKLIANGQEENHIMKAAPLNAIPVKRGVVLRKPQRKVHAKPNPGTVIGISKHDPNVANNKAEVSAKKKATNTLTSVLSARSKLACEIPKKQRLDIDAGDQDNELAVVEYVEDIYKFYKLAENESRVHSYMCLQEEIDTKMRSTLIDWLVEVHMIFQLALETLYLTINILDRYMASKPVLRKELQLLGISAMLVASKYEEICAPAVNEFVSISNGAYTHQQVLVMEKLILGQLEWTLTVPTPYVFLVRFIKASVPDEVMENLVYFLAELGVMNYATIIYSPSMIAASAVYAARCTLRRSPVWNETLMIHTGYSEIQVMDCAKLLVKFHWGAATNKLKAIYNKYSTPEKKRVSLIVNRFLRL